MKVAIIGAGEFVGDRLVEALQLGDGPPFAALGGNQAALLRAARFAIDLRLADFLNVESLARGLAGCSSVVYVTQPPPAEAKRAATVLCRAAAQAGARRVIYLGSADVHGLAPAEGTDEKTALHTRHESAVCNALVHAERQFLNECRQLSLAGYVLRPGVVYGPRCPLVSDVALALQNSRAWLYQEGRGVFNGLYVDNLVHAIRLVLKTKAAAGSAFLLGDGEAPTWRDFLHAIAEELTLPISAIHSFQGDPPADAGAAATETAPPASLPPRANLLPPPTAELLARQQATWQLPVARAARELGYRPHVTFAEGMRRSCAWWRFAQGDFTAAA